jgi:serine/threonine-protein kinase
MTDSKDPPAATDERTVFAPGTPTVAEPPASAAPADPRLTVMAPRVDGNRIQVGDILNHIFEVKRFIARGGMGEVFEGINVNSDERVAIKVMLPALAADPNVQAMFRKEARTLTRLSHPALVQYRVLAQEPQLGVFYIVTEFIDGRNLSDVLATVPNSADNLIALARRLADGLRVAHGLGAVHRDISPDNVLLEDGVLENAKIIDFGIAKDLDPSKGTIVGDGFAGKLNYVAPEQLGDFNREVGPWTDVYSLALVILAVAMHRDVDMGATLVDAVDKRRAGPNLSMVPGNVRPVLEAMLQPNPVNRLRSMDEVIAALDVVPFALAQNSSRTSPTAEPGRAPQHSAAGVSGIVAAQSASDLDDSETALAKPGPSRSLIFGGAGAAAIVIAVIAGFVMTRPAKPPLQTARPQATTPAGPPPATSLPPAEAARAALIAALPGVGCSWLDIREIKTEGTGVAISVKGVAGSPAAAQGALASAVTAHKVRVTNIDFEGVAPIQSSACPVLDAYRAIKSTSAPQLTADQIKFEMSMQQDGPQKGKVAAVPQIHLAQNAANPDLTLLGIEADGSITQLLTDRKDLQKLAEMTPGARQADGSTTLRGAVTTQGWSGNILLTGKGPFSAQLVAPALSIRNAEWQAKLARTAAAQGWKAEMVWFKVVDEVPN